MNNSELKSKLQKSLDFLQTELSQIRTGRATPALVEDIVVDAYGTKMTVKELGSISLLDAQNIVIQIWDRGLQGSVASAIRESDLKVNPVVDGANIRVPIPSLTEERRAEFAKVASSKVEEAKNSMRNIRQDAMKDIDRSFADKELSEDEKFSGKENVEELVKEYVDKAEELGENKKSDLMRV